MLKKILPAVFILLVLAAQPYADVIRLKDGRMITGEVIERNQYQTVVRDERGMVNRFYNDQVADIAQGETAAAVVIDKAQFEGISSEKIDLIARLMEVNGTRRNLEKNIKDTIAQAPGPRKEEFRKLFDLNEILARMVPVYDRYFDEEELRALIGFYESPVGGKLLQISPELIKDSAQASLQYFQEKLTQ